MSTEHVAYQDVTIEDVDQSVYDWMDKIVNAYVQHPSKELRKVPVIFSSGERWASARDRKGIRDSKGILILPLISVRRTTINRDFSMAALGTETKNITIAKRVDGKTNRVQNAISSRTVANRSAGGKIVHEITTIPFPDRSISTYEIVIQAQYISQMNKIIEKIVDSLPIQNQAVLPISFSRFESDPDNVEFEDRKKLEGYYFVGFMDTDLSDSGNMEEFTDTERIIKYSFSMTVPTYLQLDPEGTRPAIQTQLTAFDIKFPEERVKYVENEEEWDIIFSVKKPT